MNTGIKQTESTSSCASAPDSTSRPMLLVRHPLVKKFHKNPSLTISKIRIIGLSSSCKNSVGTFLYPHLVQNQHQHLTSCRWAAATVCPRPLPPRGRRSASRGRADGNVVAVSHGQHVPTLTAAAVWRANTAVSKAACDLDLWPWKWCPSHLWRGLPLWQFWSRPLCSWLMPDVCDRQTDVRQHHRLMPRLLGAGA